MPTDDSPLQAAADTASDVVEKATDAVDRAIDEIAGVPSDDGRIEEFSHDGATLIAEERGDRAATRTFVLVHGIGMGRKVFADLVDEVPRGAYRALLAAGAVRRRTAGRRPCSRSRARATASAASATSVDSRASQRSASWAVSTPMAQPGSKAESNRRRGNAAIVTARLRSSYQRSSNPHGSVPSAAYCRSK